MLRRNLKIKQQLTRIFTFGVLVLIILSTTTLAGAAPAENIDINSPEAVIKQCVNESISILNDPAYKNINQKELLNKILFTKCEPTFDFKALARGVLGRNWRRFSDQQRDEFSKYFSHLIAQTYFAKLDRKTIKETSIKYLKTNRLPPTRSGIERADITAEVFHSGKTTPVVYRMLKRKHGRWKIYDLKIEGVSLVSNYREQYRDKFMETPEKIIDELKAKVNM